MDKEKRLELIKLLLKNNEISTVRELSEILEAQYNLIFSMTTVAKDLQYLNVTKVPNGANQSYYVLPEKNSAKSIVKHSKNIDKIVLIQLLSKIVIS